MYLLLLSVSLLLQNLRPSVITRSFEITRMIQYFNNMLVTYWGVDFTLVFEYSFLVDFRRTTFGGKFGYRRRLGVCP